MKSRSKIAFVTVIAIMLVVSIVSMSGCLFMEFKKWGETYTPTDDFDKYIDLTIHSYYQVVKERYEHRTTLKDERIWDDIFINAYRGVYDKASLYDVPRAFVNEVLSPMQVNSPMDYPRYFHAMRVYTDFLNKSDEYWYHGTTAEYREKYMNFLENYDPKDINVANGDKCALELSVAKDSWILEHSQHHNEAKNLVLSMIENKPLCTEKVNGNYFNACLLNALYAQNNTYTKEDLKMFLGQKTFSDTENGKDFGLDGAALIMYAACNINPRVAQDELGLEQDIIEYLNDNLVKIGSEPSGQAIRVVLNDKDLDVDDPANASISILYVGLLGYKYQRSSATAVHMLVG